MELKKHNGDSIDLAEEDKNNKWAEEIVSNLTQKIPIMTAIAKRTESTSFHFVGLARHAALAETLIFLLPGTARRRLRMD